MRWVVQCGAWRGGVALAGLVVAACSGSQAESGPALSQPAEPPEAPLTAAPKPVESAAAVAEAAGDEEQVTPPAEPAEVPSGPRIGSTRWYTFIYEKPRRTKLPLGGVRIGTTVPLKSDKPVTGYGCAEGKWYAVEPYGFVCADNTTTMDFDTPLWKILSSVKPRPGPYPYSYAYSNGANMYNRVPTKAEWTRAEFNHSKSRKFKTLGKWAETHEKLVVKDPDDYIQPDSQMPGVYKDHQMIPGSHWNQPLAKVRYLPPGSGVSYARAFEAEGRTWLLTSDLLLVAADRVFRFERQTFKGVELGSDVNLPLAWITAKKGQPRYERKEDGKFEKTSARLDNKAYVQLTGERVRQGPAVYWRAKEEGLWVRQRKGVAIAQAVKKLPGLIKPDQRWVDARIMTGYAVAYEGLTPRYTTLWSAGKGGVPQRGKDTVKDNIRNMTTSVGIFGFQWKEKVATMSPDVGEPTVFWFADVPHIQYVKPPLALHVSYWHQNYGNLMSAECLNFSPADAQWLFDFTLPHPPPGWNAIRSGKDAGPSTRIVLRPL